MEMFAFKKIKNDKSEEVEVIHSSDVAYMTTGGKRAFPVAVMKDGTEYYLAASYEEYKLGLEIYKDFEVVDRCYVVNMNKVDYFEPKESRLVYEHKECNMFVVIARKYFDKIKTLAQRLGIETR